MFVYEVIVYNCESSATICVCSSKDIAERELFKRRDGLIQEWERMERYDKKSYKELGIEIERSAYREMIENLSSDDYENWDNYPHDNILIKKTEVIEE